MNISFDIGYKNNLIYENVSINFKDSGIIYIVGENGSGKSTFYKTITGLIKPLKGEIPSDLQKKMAIVSDYIHIPDELEVQDLLYIFDTNKLDFFSKQFPFIFSIIKSFSTQKISTLSTGQKRILEISMVLLKGKKIILFDEAMNGLDFRNRALFLEAIQIISKAGILCFVTTHELEDMLEVPGEIYVLFKDIKTIKQYTYSNEIDIQDLKKYILMEGKYD